MMNYYIFESFKYHKKLPHKKAFKQITILYSFLNRVIGYVQENFK